MNCKDFLDFLNAYTDGELKEKLRVSFERHVGDCPPCRDFLDGYEKTSKLAHRCVHADAPHHEPPPDALVNAILAACAEVGCSSKSSTASAGSDDPSTESP